MLYTCVVLYLLATYIPVRWLYDNFKNACTYIVTHNVQQFMYYQISTDN